MPVPGATTSGLIRPSFVGPRPLNAARPRALFASLSRRDGIVVRPPFAVRQDLRRAIDVREVRSIALARANGDAVARRSRRSDRVQIDDAIGIFVDTAVSRRDHDDEIAIAPYERIDVVRLLRIPVVLVAPRVRMNARAIGVCRRKQLMQIVRKATQSALRIQDRLHDQLRLRCGSADRTVDGRNPIPQHRPTNVRAVTVRIAGGRSAKCDELQHAAREGRRQIERIAFVETGIAHRDNLVGALERGTGLNLIRAQQTARDIVPQLLLFDRLDVANLIECSDRGESIRLHANAKLATRRLQIRRIDPGGVADRGRDRCRIDIAMQHDIDELRAGLRRCRDRALQIEEVGMIGVVGCRVQRGCDLEAV